MAGLSNTFKFAFAFITNVPYLVSFSDPIIAVIEEIGREDILLDSTIELTPSLMEWQICIASIGGWCSKGRTPGCCHIAWLIV